MSVRFSDSRYRAVAVSVILFVADVCAIQGCNRAEKIAARCAELTAEHYPQSVNCPGKQWKADYKAPTNCFVRLAFKGNYGCCIEACRAMNASIACISSKRQNDFMDIVGNCGEGKERGAQGFFGLYQTAGGVSLEVGVRVRL